MIIVLVVTTLICTIETLWSSWEILLQWVKNAKFKTCIETFLHLPVKESEMIPQVSNTQTYPKKSEHKRIIVILRHFQVMEKLFVKYDCSLSVFKHHDVWLWNVFHYTEIGSTQQFICRFQKSESRTQTSKKAWKSTIINQNTKYFRFLQSTKRWY